MFVFYVPFVSLVNLNTRQKFNMDIQDEQEAGFIVFRNNH